MTDFAEQISEIFRKEMQEMKDSGCTKIIHSLKADTAEDQAEMKRKYDVLKVIGPYGQCCGVSDTEYWVKEKEIK